VDVGIGVQVEVGGNQTMVGVDVLVGTTKVGVRVGMGVVIGLHAEITITRSRKVSTLL